MVQAFWYRDFFVPLMGPGNEECFGGRLIFLTNVEACGLTQQDMLYRQTLDLLLVESRPTVGLYLSAGNVSKLATRISSSAVCPEGT